MILKKVEYCDLFARNLCIYREPRCCPYAYALSNIGDCNATFDEYCSFQEAVVKNLKDMRRTQLEKNIAYWDAEIEKANSGGDSLIYWTFRNRRRELQEELDNLDAIPYMKDE